jgi:hypothetical protein
MHARLSWFRILGDLVHFLCLGLRSRASLAAENLFLRKQLAFYQERTVKPRRADNPTRLTLVLLSRWFNWRDALTVVRPKTLIRLTNRNSPRVGLHSVVRRHQRNPLPAASSARWRQILCRRVRRFHPCVRPVRRRGPGGHVRGRSGLRPTIRCPQPLLTQSKAKGDRSARPA